MKKWLWFTVFCGFVVASVFAGNLISHKRQISKLAEEIASLPINPPAKVARAETPAVSSSVSAVASRRAVISSHYEEKDIQLVRKVLKLKKYESISLRPSQRESFKKIFVTVATDPKANWMIQRQALRNLYKQNIKLDEDDQKLILAHTDQRAISNYTEDEKELLQEVVQSL